MMIAVIIVLCAYALVSIGHSALGVNVVATTIALVRPTGARFVHPIAPVDTNKSPHICDRAFDAWRRHRYRVRRRGRDESYRADGVHGGPR